MNRNAFFSALLVLGAFNALGCVTPDGLARTRASNEFNCPEDQVRLQRRSELSDGTYDVNACGHVARYTCLVARGDHGCAREPIDTTRIKLESAPAASHSTPAATPPAQ